jgi:hypothetical protein
MASVTACGVMGAGGRGRGRLWLRVGGTARRGPSPDGFAVRPEPPTRPLDSVCAWCYDAHMATKTTTLTVRVGPRLREQIEERAAEAEMNTGEFVRFVMAEYIRSLEETDRTA